MRSSDLVSAGYAPVAGDPLTADKVSRGMTGEKRERHFCYHPHLTALLKGEEYSEGGREEKASRGMTGKKKGGEF